MVRMDVREDPRDRRWSVMEAIYKRKLRRRRCHLGHGWRVSREGRCTPISQANLNLFNNRVLFSGCAILLRFTPTSILRMS